MNAETFNEGDEAGLPAYTRASEKRLLDKKRRVDMPRHSGVIPVSWLWRVALLLTASIGCAGAVENIPTARSALPIAALEARTTDPILVDAPTKEFLTASGFGAAQAEYSRWHALYLRQDGLEISPVTKMRSEPMPFSWSTPNQKLVRLQPELAGQPVMLLRVRYKLDGSSGSAPAFVRTRPAGLLLNELLREGWRQTVRVAGKDWTLSTSGLKNTQARLLPGSMELKVAAPGAAPIVVLGKTQGHVFKEQRVVWMGDLNGDGLPDFYIRRTLATGLVDHIISLSAGPASYVIAGITQDTDQPQSDFTSGVGDIEIDESRLANSPSPYAEVVLPDDQQEAKAAKPAARYAISGAMSLKRYPLVSENRMVSLLAPLGETDGKTAAPAQSQPLAAVLKDMRFDLDGENYRLVVETLETYGGQTDPTSPSYTTQAPFGEFQGGGLSLQISLYFRGQRQVLLVTSTFMDTSPSLTAGDLDGSGKLSIQIDYYPHYNNRMTYTWVRSDNAAQIMKRSVVSQSQGC